jgi:hypothetical protein
MSDGRPVHCPKCFGSSNPAPTSRPPSEILERKQRDRRRDKNPGKLRRVIGFLWAWIFDPIIFLWERIFATLRFLWEQIFKP